MSGFLIVRVTNGVQFALKASELPKGFVSKGQVKGDAGGRDIPGMPFLYQTAINLAHEDAAEQAKKLGATWVLVTEASVPSETGESVAHAFIGTAYGAP